MGREQKRERVPVLGLVEHPHLGRERRLPLLHPPLRLLQLGGEEVLLGDQLVEPVLVVAQARVVLEQLGIE